MTKIIQQGIDIIEQYESKTGKDVAKYIYNSDVAPVIIQEDLLSVLMKSLPQGDFYNQCQNIIDKLAQLQKLSGHAGAKETELMDKMIKTLDDESIKCKFLNDYAKRQRNPNFNNKTM